MPRQVSIDSITNAVLNGFLEAQTNYELWSGGCWLWEAPEYLITSTVAKHIAELSGSKYITLEHGATSVLENAGAKGKGLLQRKIREKGKVDILLWWGEGTPRAIIEIKNQIFAKEQYQKDIERIIGFLSRNSQDSSLQFGIFAFYESENNDDIKTATEKIEERIKKIYQNSNAIIGENFSITKTVSDITVVEDSAWAAICLIIKHKN